MTRAKSVFFPLLTLVFVLAGCSSSSSIENQTKLLEYEKCMEWNERMYDREIAVLATMSDTYEKATTRIDIGNRLSKLKYENLLEACKQYRP
jgi:hypothetical protein